ncbi:hypothetical protein K7I13_06290 [Brucepastera parasyntrophica]|uniref:hypothetical protein n=1 Tax=Brucepastera parasyntrophica TaxID=2880008 RepID=UPI00210D9968|nr:hypothetical protein [Brucepastera parasyntrophica]ULQ60871.1 hypothetical protein K7I13_06290 [Brucepastera parasyntrophica]
MTDIPAQYDTWIATVNVYEGATQVGIAMEVVSDSSVTVTLLDGNGKTWEDSSASVKYRVIMYLTDGTPPAEGFEYNKTVSGNASHTLSFADFTSI